MEIAILISICHVDQPVYKTICPALEFSLQTTTAKIFCSRLYSLSCYVGFLRFAFYLKAWFQNQLFVVFNV